MRPAHAFGIAAKRIIRFRPQYNIHECISEGMIIMKRHRYIGLLSIVLVTLPWAGSAWRNRRSVVDRARACAVPPGFVVEVIAEPPLVLHPMMANFDERGRLFVAESSGINMKADELLKALPHKVLLLENADAKGRFQKRGSLPTR